jgi:hypothetical protein
MSARPVGAFLIRGAEMTWRPAALTIARIVSRTKTATICPPRTIRLRSFNTRLGAVGYAFVHAVREAGDRAVHVIGRHGRVVVDRAHEHPVDIDRRSALLPVSHP